MKLLIKIIGGGFVVLMVAVVIGYFILNRPLPDGIVGVEADQMADEMMAALNKDAFDSIGYIEFKYRTGYSYEWYKNDEEVNVITPEGEEIYLDLSRNVDSFSEAEYNAYKFFINDTFWLVAPFKVWDSGVVRSKVRVDNARGLMVTYQSGGVTPGDSYLWILDENGFPIAWRMWVSILPVGGLEISWENWEQHKGAWFSTYHKGLIELPITDLLVL